MVWLRKTETPAQVCLSCFQLILFLAIMLWSYQSLDDRARIRKEAQQLEEWVEAGKAQVT